MLILRMENDDGKGPFSGTYSTAEEVKSTWRHVPWMDVKPDGALFAKSNEYPHHLRDCLGTDGCTAFMMEAMGIAGSALEGKWLVGCDSRKEFEHWFPAESLADFAERGFHLSIYEVAEDDCKVGKYQVMFRADKAELIRTEPLADVMKEAA